MKDMEASEVAGDNAADVMSARFAHMVAQQSSMAVMLMGKSAHPETGETVRDLDAARFFIDQLEMLQVKTKGNLSAEEAGLLKQSLMSLRMAYVESVNAPAPASAAPPPGAAPEGQAKPEPAPAAAAGESESHKKFTKKY
jgi:hypothetical protein